MIEEVYTKFLKYPTNSLFNLFYLGLNGIQKLLLFGDKEKVKYCRTNKKSGKSLKLSHANFLTDTKVNARFVQDLGKVLQFFNPRIFSKRILNLLVENKFDVFSMKLIIHDKSDM